MARPKVEFSSEMISAVFVFRAKGYTVDQVAEAIGVNKQTFLRWRVENRIILEPIVLNHPTLNRSVYPI